MWAVLRAALSLPTETPLAATQSAHVVIEKLCGLGSEHERRMATRGAFAMLRSAATAA